MGPLMEPGATTDRLVFISESLENIPTGFRARETIVFTGADQLEEILKKMAEPGKEFLGLQPQPTRTCPLAAQLILTLRWSVPYRVDIRNVADDALDRLVELGAIDAESGGPGEIAALMPDSVEREQIASALGVGAGDISVSPATGRDAGSVWVLSPRPIRIRRMTIVPAHAAAEAGALQLIDAAAFGTGLHPTTALCLEVLEEEVGIAPPDALLDVGTGSGVLALAPLMMGVPRALAININDEALRIAAENARINALGERFGWPVAVRKR